MRLRKAPCFCWYLTIVIVILITLVYKISYTDDSSSLVEYYVDELNNGEENITLKYILLWTSSQAEPFVWMGKGRRGFIDRNCSHTNCFVTSNRNYLSDYTKFDVIAFAGPQIVQENLKEKQLPRKRSPNQKYVFASIESAAQYPIHDAYFDDFFNWTWTYKLDSDLIWGYIHIKDEKGDTIGPGKTMRWMQHEQMLPTTNKLRKIFERKTKAVAWFVSNCHSINKREEFASNLNKVLQTKYNLSVDIYGKCGKLKCKDCDEMLKNMYFFYLAFENSFSEDYVTEKLSRALECNAIPIVYGGANYSRFLPNESYLDARELGVEKLATKIYELMNNLEQYAEYFRWMNHYHYYRSSDAKLKTNVYCNMCAMLNDGVRVKEVSVYKKFREWWNKQAVPKSLFALR